MDSFNLFPATLILIAVNVIASTLAWLNPAFLTANLFHISPIREKREYHRLVTAGFLHGGVFHLLINMFVLYQFGGFVEYTLGTPKFLIVYFAALLGGNLWALRGQGGWPRRRQGRVCHHQCGRGACGCR